MAQRDDLVQMWGVRSVILKGGGSGGDDGGGGGGGWEEPFSKYNDDMEL